MWARVGTPAEVLTQAEVMLIFGNISEIYLLHETLLADVDAQVGTVGAHARVCTRSHSHAFAHARPHVCRHTHARARSNAKRAPPFTRTFTRTLTGRRHGQLVRKALVIAA
jgi:hypothetical protein